jgi:hypothetical protein
LLARVLEPAAFADGASSSAPVIVRPSEASPATVADLLAGVGKLSALPRDATSQGRPFDRELRERLTTRTVEYRNPDYVRPWLSMPKGEIQIGKATSLASIDNLEATVNKLKPGYRQCYNKGLEQDPSMAGRAVFVANVGPNGEVTSVDVRENSGLSDFVLDCIKKKIRNAEFAPPGGGGAPVQLPVNFIKQ